jgi:hypothetical protein
MTTELIGILLNHKGHKGHKRHKGGVEHDPSRPSSCAWCSVWFENSLCSLWLS